MPNATQVDTKYRSPKSNASRAAPVTVTNLVATAVSVAIVRPANTTAYTANDVVGQADATVAANAGSAILKFADIGNLSGLVKIVGASLLDELGAVPASMGNFTLHLFNAAPDAVLDNAAFDLASAGDRSKYLGSVLIGTPVDIGSSLWIENNALAKQVKLAAGSTDLYGVLVTAGAYTPASGEKITVTLQVENKA